MKIPGLTKPKYIVFDLETTGLNLSNCEIIEIAAIKVEDDKIVDKFESLIKPFAPIPDEITLLTGINSEALIDKPYIFDILPMFTNFIDDYPLLGYNIKRFDYPILQRALNDWFGENLDNEIFDIYSMAKERLNDVGNYKLSTIASRFNIKMRGQHRALFDCITAYRCYKELALIRPKPKKGMSDYNDKTKALQNLQTIIVNITQDDIIDANEIMVLDKWLESHELSGSYPFDQIYSVVKDILSKGILEQYDVNSLNSIFFQFLNPTSDSFDSELELKDKIVVLTGEFEFGEKEDVADFLIENGCIIRGSVSKRTDYVFIGNLGNPNWSFGAYGSKVKKAKELQANGAKVIILSESDLKNILLK